MKKIIITTLVLVGMLAFGGIIKTNAGTLDNVTGWLWGGAEQTTPALVCGVDSSNNPIYCSTGSVDGNETGVGWINTNCATQVDTNGDNIGDASMLICNGGYVTTAYKNCNGPGAVACLNSSGNADASLCSLSACANPNAGNYGLNIPVSGQVTGYAWSSNLGLIDFDPVGSCTANKYTGACESLPASGCSGACPTTGVVRNGDNLEGWARIVSIADAYATTYTDPITHVVSNNSGDWKGWIKLSGSDYGVTINPLDGTLGGHAWSDELGSVSFKGNNYGATLPMPPSGSLAASPSVLILDATNPTLSPARNVTLSWEDIKDATYCVKSWGGGGNLSSLSDGSDSTVTQSVPTVTYSLHCYGLGGDTVISTTVTSGCYIKSCSGTTCATPGSPSHLGTASNYTNDCEQICDSDSDCTPRSTGTWREVQP